MLCEQVHEHLSAYLDKELTAELSAAVRSHLESCAECRTLLADLRATADLLGRLPVHAAPEQTAQDVQREIERRVLVGEKAPAEEPLRERTLPLHRARLWPRALAVAATVALAAGIGILAYLTRNQPALTAPEITTLVLREEAPAMTEGRYRADRPEARKYAEEKPSVSADYLAKGPTTPADTAGKSKWAARPEGTSGQAFRRALAPGLKDEEAEEAPLREGQSLAQGPAAAPAAPEGGAKNLPGFHFGAPAAPDARSPRRPQDKAETARPSLEEAAVAGRATTKGGAVADSTPDSSTATKAHGKAGDEPAMKAGVPAVGPQMAGGQAQAVQTPAPAAPPAQGLAEKGGQVAGTVGGKPVAGKPVAGYGVTEKLGRPQPETAKLTEPAPAGEPSAPPAPPPTAVAKAPGAMLSMTGRLAPAAEEAGQTFATTGPAAVQRVMVSVVDGLAALDDLKAVVTRDNLSRAEYQLVLVADSRREGDQALRQLFQANAWQPVSTDKAGAARGAMKKAAGTARAGEDLRWGQQDTGGAKPLPPGLYYVAPNGSEDTWVVLTDRDNLSRFAGQLAQAQALTVSTDSSAMFRPVRDLQKEYRQYATATDSLAAAKAQPAEKQREAEDLDLTRLRQSGLGRNAPEGPATPPVEKMKEADRPDLEGYTVAKPRQRTRGEEDGAEATAERVRERVAGTPSAGGAAKTPAGIEELPPVRLGIAPGKPAATAAPSATQPLAEPNLRQKDGDKAGATQAGADLYGLPTGGTHRLQKADDRVLVVIHVRQADEAGKAAKETQAAPGKK
ncbi:MAG: anti-sigma factor [Planctomycetota bacterium]|nr:anti-sigma factor [Planctomycetota bacterium]